MADQLETPSFDGFGIQDTMQMGMGSAELLQDLLAPETSTGDPAEITPIIKDAAPPAPDKKPDVPKGKEVVPVEEGKEPAPQDVIHNFLGADEDEEPENQTPPVDTPPDAAPKDDEPEPVSQFTSLAKDLFNLGVFTTDDDDEPEAPITTAQEFLDRFNIEKRKGATAMVQNFIGQFGEDYQAAFDAIYVKGVHPKTYFDTYNAIVDFTNLDMSIEENQVAVVRQTLTENGLEPEDVASEIERLKNYADLEAVSAKYHKVLVKKQAAKLAQMEAESEREMQQRAAIKTQYIQNVTAVLQDKLKTKEFDGIPINPKLANELQDFLLVDKYKLKSGELLTEFDYTILELKRPENHSKKVKLALLLKILEKDPTLSTIQKTGVTKQSNTLFSETVRQVSKSTKEPNAPSNSKEWKGL